jgi:hypothetical protein
MTTDEIRYALAKQVELSNIVQTGCGDFSLMAMSAEDRFRVVDAIRLGFQNELTRREQSA